MGFKILLRFVKAYWDHDDPPSSKELEQFRREVQKMMPDASRADLSSNAPVLASTKPADRLDMPTFRVMWSY